MIHHYSSNSHIRRTQNPTGGLANSEHSCPSGRESDFEGDTNSRRDHAITKDQSDSAHTWRRWCHRRQAIGSKVDSTSNTEERDIGGDRETGWRQSSEAALLRTLRAFERAQRELEMAVGRVSDEKRALSAAVRSHKEWPSGGASGAALLKQKESRLQRAKCLLRNAAFRFDDVERTLEAAVGALSDEDSDEEDEEMKSDGVKCRSRRRQRRRASITIEDDAEDCTPPPPSGFVTQSSNSTPPPTTPRHSLCLESSPKMHELLSDVDDADAEATKNDLNAKIQLESDTGSSDYSEIVLSEDAGICDEIPVDGEHSEKEPSLSQRSANELLTSTPSSLGVHPQSTASPVSCACRFTRQHWPQERDPRHQQQLQPQRPQPPGEECIRSEDGTETHIVSESAFAQRLLARLLRCCKSALQCKAICLLLRCRGFVIHKCSTLSFVHENSSASSIRRITLVIWNRLFL